MAVIVRLTYESRGGETIPRPNNYPDEIRFPEATNPHWVTDEIVATAVECDLQAHNVTRKDVVICWTAINDIPETGKPS